MGPKEPGTEQDRVPGRDWAPQGCWARRCFVTSPLYPDKAGQQGDPQEAVISTTPGGWDMGDKDAGASRSRSETDWALLPKAMPKGSCPRSVEGKPLPSSQGPGQNFQHTPANPRSKAVRDKWERRDA